MALPANLTTREIIGQYMDLAGSYLTGTVEFTIEPILTDGGAGVVIIPTPLIAELDSEGRFSKFVLTTDDPDVNPTGFRYKVVEKFTGSSGRMFYLDVPGGSTEPIDLSKIVVPGEPVNGETTYVNLGALTAEQDARIQGDADTLAAAKAYTDAELILSNLAGTSVAGVAAAGVSEEVSRADHVHSGVALTGDQSISGRKTFLDPAMIQSAVADALLTLEQTDPAAIAGVFKLIGGNATNAVFLGRGQEHTANAWAIRANGTFEIGDGVGGRDCVLSRSGPNELSWTANVKCTEVPTDVSHWTRKDYVDGLDASNVKLSGDQTVAGIKTFSSIPVGPAADPTLGNQFARKAYVDSVAAGGGSGTYQPLSEKDQPGGYAGLDLNGNISGAAHKFGDLAAVKPLGMTADEGVTDAAARADHVHPLSNFWTPEDHGMLAWTFEPSVGQSTPKYCGDDIRRFALVKVHRDVTVTNLVWHFTGYAGNTTGSGLSTGSWAGIYDFSGNILEQTIDLNVNDWLTAGVHEPGGEAVEAPLLAPVNITAGMYYILWNFNYDENHVNGNAGPMLMCAEDDFGEPPGVLGVNKIQRWGFQTGNTASVPPSPLLVENYTKGSTRFWAGLS